MKLPDLTVAERPKQEIADPEQLPVLCELPANGVWPVSCWETFVKYEEIAHGNYTIAVANTSALRESDAAYDSLLEAAMNQQYLASFREDLLQEERRAHTLDKWTCAAAVGLSLAIGANK